MADTTDPFVSCKLPIDVSLTARLEIRLPFIGNAIQASASLDLEVEDQCKQLSLLLPQVQASLAALYPIIKIADCVLKVISCVQDLLAIIGGLPAPDPADITKFVDDVGALSDCITFLAGVALPTIPLCHLALDLVRACKVLLQCVKDLFTLTIGVDDRIVELNASLDVDLNIQAACLQTQNDRLKAALEQKLDTVQIVLTLLNTVIGLVPPLVSTLGAAYPITASTSLDITALDNAIAALQDVEDILFAFCP